MEFEVSFPRSQELAIGTCTEAVESCAYFIQTNFNAFPFKRVFVAGFPAKITVLLIFHCGLKSIRVKFVKVFTYNSHSVWIRNLVCRLTEKQNSVFWGESIDALVRITIKV